MHCDPTRGVPGAAGVSLIAQMVLIDKYGLRLNLDQLAEALGLAKGTITNQIGAGTFPIPTYLDGKRYADARDVAEYFDLCRERAHADLQDAG